MTWRLSAAALLASVLVASGAAPAAAEGPFFASDLAIFSASTSCVAGLEFNGEAILIAGHVHSNGQYAVNAAPSPDNLWAASGTIARENCVAAVNPDGPPAEAAGARYGDGTDWLPADGTELDWPVWYAPSEFGWYLPPGPGPGRCTFRAQHIEADTTHLKIRGRPDQPLAPHPTRPGWTVLPTGTYCATETFRISGDNHSGTITVLAPSIQINGSGQVYEPHAHDVLFFTVPNSNFVPEDDDAFSVGSFGPPEFPPYPPCSPAPGRETKLDGANFALLGVLFNPCGRVTINSAGGSAGDPQLVGAIYAFQVRINGDGFSMVGRGGIPTDTEPPQITAVVTPDANAAGWHSTPPTVTFLCTDAASGVASCPEPVTVSSEGVDQVVEGTALDNAGNSASVAVTVSLDLTAPLMLLVRPADDSVPATSPAGAIVPFFAVAFDALAGHVPVACTLDPGSVFPIGETTVTCSASDPAGNATEQSFTVFVEADTAPPEIAAVVTPDANAAGWHSTTPTVTFICTDSGSGVDFCPQPVTVSSEGMGQVIEGTALDNFGNSASVSVTVNVDLTAPGLILPGDFSTPATSPAGAVVTFSADAFDDLAGPLPPTCTPGSGSVFPIGETTVSCSAADPAGNTVEDSFTVLVLGTSAQVKELSEALDAVVAAQAGSPIADKVEDAASKLDSALAELSKTPPDRQAAAAAIEGAAGDLEAAVSSGLQVSSARIDAVVGVGRLLAETAIAEARARGANPSKIAEAEAARDEGDARRAAGAFKDAGARFKDSVAKAEGA